MGTYVAIISTLYLLANILFPQNKKINTKINNYAFFKHTILL